MIRSIVRALPLAALLSLGLPAAAGDASAEIKIGLGVEKLDVKDAAETFKVAPETKIYAWTKVTGLEGGAVTLSFQKEGKEVFQKELEVPRSPHRTNAYRTFRKGDGGAWTVKALDKEGKELGTASFTVTVE
jgi:hypothetical protein